MATIKELLNRVNSVKIRDLEIKAVMDTADALADLNVMQMMSGIRSDGSPITPSYSAYTIELKKAKGQPTDRVTLRDTGAFQQGLHVELTGEKVTVTSSDPKTKKLKNKYSKAKGDIFGLSDNYRSEYIRESLRPTFAKIISEATGLRKK